MDAYDTTEPETLTTLLRKDLRKAAQTLGIGEVRFLVDTYYAWQDFRIASGNQAAALTKAGEPHEVVAWTQERIESMEGDIRAVLDSYTRTEPTGMGRWARGVVGIGPVLAAGLCAHIDITKAPTVGHIWRFAGLDPTQSWNKGEKRPWNASLKVLCWKMGESFVKVSGNPRDIYGKVYLDRKAYEQRRNDAGELAPQAAAKLERYRIGKDTGARAVYESGKLPPAHIHARAKRYAVKLFLAHFWEVAYRRHYGTEPPLPYAVAHLGHVHVIPAPVLVPA